MNYAEIRGPPLRVVFVSDNTRSSPQTRDLIPRLLLRSNTGPSSDCNPDKSSPHLYEPKPGRCQFNGDRVAVSLTPLADGPCLHCCVTSPRIHGRIRPVSVAVLPVPGIHSAGSASASSHRRRTDDGSQPAAQRLNTTDSINSANSAARRTG